MSSKTFFHTKITFVYQNNYIKKSFKNISKVFYSVQDMRCGNLWKFDADRSITKLSKNQQTMVSLLMCRSERVKMSTSIGNHTGTHTGKRTHPQPGARRIA
jgi:hypothetical protein